ncbi:MAG: RNHCP domain-containing protein [Alphaproteobacteria bacterium]|nr:RNHCP domain-containing protein [Alphaproteobacteria bacterium]
MRSHYYGGGGKLRRSRTRAFHVEKAEFRCCRCKSIVGVNIEMGTAHRNHCPLCLWSRHVDTKPGNRASNCHGGMAPVGLAFARKGADKFGRPRTGDVMLVHVCQSCRAVNLNRIAGDDCPEAIMAVFTRSLGLAASDRERLASQGAVLLPAGDEEELRVSLYGKFV